MNIQGSTVLVTGANRGLGKVMEGIRKGIEHVLSDEPSERLWKASRQDPASLHADMQALWDKAHGH